MKKALIVALAAGLILPVSSAYAAEENQNLVAEIAEPVAEDNKEIAPANLEENPEENLIKEAPDLPTDITNKDVEELIETLDRNTEEINKILDEEPEYEIDEILEEETGVENVSDQRIKFDGVAKTIDKVNLQVYIPCGSNFDVVSIKEYANAVKDSKLNFDFVEDGKYIYLTKGQNYQGSAYKKLDKENSTLTNHYQGFLVVDGKEIPITIYKINGETYIDTYKIDEALAFRTRRNLEDREEILVNSDKSDIKVPSINEFHQEIKKADHTILFNWAPWCRDSQHEIKMLERYAKRLEQEGKGKVQILGMIKDSDKYTTEEISVLFKDKKSAWTNFGTNEEINNEILRLLGKVYVKDWDAYFDINDLDSLITYPNDPDYYISEPERYYMSYPTSFIVDKNLKMQGKTFEDYYEEYLNLYLAKNNITREEYDDKYIYEQNTYWRYREKLKNRPFDDNIREIIYSNFLDYALNNKKVSLDDKNLLAEKTTNVDPIKVPKASQVKTTTKAKANPKTGVGPVTGIIGLLGAASLGLKKTKRD